MHSQNNEEQIISDYFKDFVGTFLDLGANDGVTLSNTYPLVLSGWLGVLVEASPQAYKKLEQNYSDITGSILMNVAIGTKNKKVTFYESGPHFGDGDIGLLSTTRQEDKARWVKETFTEIEVPQIDFKTLLKRSFYKGFNFISMDIEGMELEVLPQMDLNKLGCKMICVEYNGKDQEKYDEIIIPQWYKLIHKNLENLIYAK